MPQFTLMGIGYLPLDYVLVITFKALYGTGPGSLENPSFPKGISLPNWQKELACLSHIHQPRNFGRVRSRRRVFLRWPPLFGISCCQ